jgi:hypothetical protein
MIDADAVTRMVEQQIAKTVNDQVLTVLTSDEWLEDLEKKILQYTQNRILGKFANASSMPEIISAVKESVSTLFAEGNIPGVSQFVDATVVKSSVNQAVENSVQTVVDHLFQDPKWLSQIERQISQTVTQRIVSTMGGIDFNPMIQQRVDENMIKFRQDLLTKFSSTGIDDRATACQLTVMDHATVVENNLTTQALEVMGTAVIRDLAVTGTVNINNPSWQFLSDAISEKTLEKINTEWKDQLVDQVKQKISQDGIEFDQVKIGDSLLVENNALSASITDSRLQTVGHLKDLTVRGQAKINDTVHVVSRRLGINTDAPEMALSVWDEEVSVVIGKNKSKQAYIGTNRDQGLAIGVNRDPQIEVDTSGLTTIKQLRVGLHKFGHATQVPGWSGTRGDIVFNSNPGSDRVFAWVCLGAHRWQTLKSAE